MESSLNIGRIAGIRVGVNWTWLFVFALAVWSLATLVFPARNPGLSGEAYWTMGTVAAVAFFVSILLHELGHAFVGRREGVEIEGITLWLFGGVARFADRYPSAGAELRIALAGPAVSAVVATVLILFGWLVPLPASIDAVVVWLGYINVLVLAFNLLPALPLDGGRVLHAALWGGKDDLVWATRTGTAIGRGFAFAMIGGGIVLFFLGAFVTGIWLAFIGWFLMTAAGAEARYLIARETLGDLRVDALMVRDPVTVSPDLTVGEFMDDVVWRSRHTTYPVVEAGKPVGLLPFRCVAHIPRAEWDTRRVRDCMLPRGAVPMVETQTKVADLLPELTSDGVKRALVVQDGMLVGLISLTDVALAQHAGRSPHLDRHGARTRGPAKASRT